MRKNIFTYLKCLLLMVFVYQATITTAQRQMEKLDRGLVAVQTSGGVFLSWRVFGTDPENVAFNIYRNGTKVNPSPITGATNMVDRNGSLGAVYTVRPVIGGSEQGVGATANVWDSQVRTINLSNRPSNNHQPNDINVGDLDGDGQYELVVKWYPNNAKDNSQSGVTDNTYLAAYKMDGTFLWIIDLGRNIRSGAHYTQHLVGDYDSDGFAEVACKTAPGTRDGAGNYLSDGPAANDNDGADYRNGSGYILSGPEYLTIFNGQTGEEMATVDYFPNRGGNLSDIDRLWGDDYGNRVDRFNSTNACLDGVHTSMVFQRGYYTRMTMAAYDWNGQTLSRRWTFDSNSPGNRGAHGQGNHSIMAADIDGDGYDELLPGSCAIDHNGTFMWSTGHGHGDANHVGDFDPNSPGLEVWQVSENKGREPDHYMIRARDGYVLWGNGSGNDNGRGMIGDIDARHPGHEAWSNRVSGTYTANGNQFTTNKPASANFRVYWDGDLQDELLNGNTIDKWNGNGSSRVLTLTGWSTNGSKSTPNISADLIGDWREEVILHDGGSRLYIHTTTIPTEHKLYTLMHDPVYRNAISWQQSSYNQPPHLGFWLGAGVENAPKPDIVLVGGALLEEGFYQISPAHSGLCLQNNAVPSQETCADADNQYWQVIKNGEAYQIRSLASGEYLGGGTNTQGENTGMSNSPVNLTLTGAANGNFFIKLASNPSLVFDVLNVSTAEGEPLILWENTGATNQHFTFTPVDIPLDCNGDAYGTAELDGCGICAGGNTGVMACAGALQGESFCDAVGVLEASNEGYVGEGYLNFDNQLGSTGNWNFVAENAGTYQIDITYANGGEAARPMTVNVNGNNAAQFNAQPSGAWTTWVTETISVTLNQGVNNIQFVANTADGGPNVDQFTWSAEGLTAGGCEMDCNGVMGGSAFEDNCGVCVSGNTGLEACTEDCNGEWGGTAVLDNCERCVGGSTGQEACKAQLELENACLIDGVQEAINLGFTGEGYANANNEIGSGIEIKLSANESKTYSFLVRYANGSANNRNLRVLVNGVEVINNVDFITTNDWTNWEYQAITIPLQAGVNEVRLEALTVQGPSNLDNLVFLEEGVTVTDCEDLVTDLVVGTSETFQLYPNPTNGVVHFNKEVKYELINSMGQRLSSGSSDQLDLSAYPAGVYLIKVKSTIYKIMRE